MILSTDILYKVIEFFNRNDLERLFIVNSYFKNSVDRYFPEKPYQILHNFTYLPFYEESCSISSHISAKKKLINEENLIYNSIVSMFSLEN